MAVAAIAVFMIMMLIWFLTFAEVMEGEARGVAIVYQ